MSHVSPEEILRQKEFMEKVKALNAQLGEQKAMVATFGCQQNENDSQRLMGMLLEMGYALTENADEADVLMMNTCAVRENAEQTVFGRLGALKKKKRDNPGFILGVCGCMTQQAEAAEKISKTYRHVDLVFGTHNLFRFPEYLYQVRAEKQKVLQVAATDGQIFEDMPTYHPGGAKAWVSVMFGCNNFCSYCVVPYVRGRERSRDEADVLAEVTALAQKGVKEVTLLGQNVNAYGKDLVAETDFAGLLEQVCRVPGISRVRFMTSHPKDISDRLLAVMAREEKICRQLHLPVQAGSDRVLSEMNRKYTSGQYLSIVRKARELMPDLTLTSDIIVGFPTETNADFEKTLDLIKQAQFDSIFSFIYSRRAHTPAADMKSVLSKEEISKNFDELLRVQNEISNAKNQAMVGSVVRILVEGESKNNPNMLCGRTEGNKIVCFAGDLTLKDAFADVKIIKAGTWSLTGELL